VPEQLAGAGRSQLAWRSCCLCVSCREKTCKDVYPMHGVSGFTGMVMHVTGSYVDANVHSTVYKMKCAVQSHKFSTSKGSKVLQLVKHCSESAFQQSGQLFFWVLFFMCI